MFNKFFKTCVSLTLVLSPVFGTVLSAVNPNGSVSTLPQCSPQLQKHFSAILKTPEGKALVEAVQKEGPIQIIAKRTSLSERFGAYFDPDRRIIAIDISCGQTDGSIIGSILFELHNASVNGEINRLNHLASKGQINKENYVRSMEYLEYENSLKASKISINGIRLGIFPGDAYLSTYANFDEHFKAQKESGHSDAFAQNYDICRRYG